MRDPLPTVTVETGGETVDLSAAKALADRVAAERLADPVCLSWFDRLRNRESPSHVSECHGDCEVPGSVEYAVSRGATLMVVVGARDYLFCYRPLGEFADR